MKEKSNRVALLLIIPCTLLLNSCGSPGIAAGCGSFSNGFPTSTTETHTRTTIVSPPSYATVNMPPPAIIQAPPVVQQASYYPAPVQQNACAPYQSQPCVSYEAPPCAPSQVGAYDPCAYQVQVPQQQPAKYTIAIPPAPSPQYTIALPQGNPPQYAIVQQQPTVQTQTPVRVQAHVPEPCE